VNYPKLMLALILYFLPTISQAGALEDARFFERVFVSVAVRVKTTPTGKIGTGFLTKIDGDDARVMLTTNEHLVDGASELYLTVPIGRTSNAAATLLSFSVPFSRDSAQQTYIPHQMDLALIIIDKASMKSSANDSTTAHFSSLPYSYYATLDNLFAGQAVVFSGYPLGLTVHGGRALLRTGSIAGVDTAQDIIYLDADAFGGSSGSPVFIDFGSQANVQFFKTHNQMLVGMVTGYVFEKKPLTTESGPLPIEQKENTGIAIVIPAETIREEAELFLHKLH